MPVETEDQKSLNSLADDCSCKFGVLVLRPGLTSMRNSLNVRPQIVSVPRGHKVHLNSGVSDPARRGLFAIYNGMEGSNATVSHFIRDVGNADGDRTPNQNLQQHF
jgi:hypothetical protein